MSTSYYLKAVPQKGTAAVNFCLIGCYFTSDVKSDYTSMILNDIFKIKNIAALFISFPHTVSVFLLITVFLMPITEMYSYMLI